MSNNNDNLEIISNNNESNNKIYENNINVNYLESESDNSIVAKIKLNYCSEDINIGNKNPNKNSEDNNYLIKQSNTFKDIYYITKERRINYNKCINTIQNKYKNHLSLKQSINRDCLNNNNYQKPNSKNCIISRTNGNITDKDLKMKYFIFLLDLFITKNAQDYLFRIIKNKSFDKNTKKYFDFPFYIKTIQRVKNYLYEKNKPNEKVSLFFNEIFNYNYKNSENSNILNKLCLLTNKEKMQLVNTNLYTGYEENELIKFLCDFTQFDKNVNSEKFITERLRHTKLKNTNIFTLVKFVDYEYKNLCKGVYCLKCYNEINICKCFSNIKKEKEFEIGDNNSDLDMEEEEFEITENEFNDDEDLDAKKQINCFDYNSNDNHGNILIKTKSKINKNNNQKILTFIVANNNK
jgi:hypothetical protein